jgi:Lipoprotein LpqB beta-propeller domain/Sporulation and spore germination
MIMSRKRRKLVTGSRRTGAGLRAAAAVFAVAVAVAGCATLQTSGPVQQVGAGQNGTSQEQDYSQPVPVGPGQGWTPTQIVAGFLAASASFTDDHAVAREYLDSAAQRSWQPGWAVTVVSSNLTTTTVPLLPRPVTNQSQLVQGVKATGLPVATISGSGQYQGYSRSSRSQSYPFTLIRNADSQWRIDKLPTSQLLLTQADFQHVYQPRDLYFLSQSGDSLVPDPVFVPQQATNTDLATGLVNALRQNPTGWLSGAAVTGFPAGSHPIGPVRINGPNATVDLGGKAVTADRHQLERMAAQLVWTLATGPTPVQSVELELDNRPVSIMGNPYQLPQAYRGWVPSQQAGAALYFIGSNGIVQGLPGAGQPGASQPERFTVAGADGLPPLSSIAVSPNGRSLAGISAGGAGVYATGLSRGAPVRKWSPDNGTCTSVSWDAAGNLWITAEGIVWLIRPGSSGAEPVSVDVPTGTEVTDFQVAPDGVRVVMVVRGPSGTQVQLGAITHSGTSASVAQPTVLLGADLPEPDAVIWYGADDIVVLAGSTSTAQLDEVPLNGGQPTVITTPDPPESVTATSPEGSAPVIAIGLSGDRILVSTDLGAFQPTRVAGQAPAYPG